MEVPELGPPNVSNALHSVMLPLSGGLAQLGPQTASPAQTMKLQAHKRSKSLFEIQKYVEVQARCFSNCLVIRLRRLGPKMDVYWCIALLSLFSYLNARVCATIGVPIPQDHPRSQIQSSIMIK